MAAVVYVIRVLILIIIFNDKGLVGGIEKNRWGGGGELEKRVKGKNREKVVGNIEKGWVGRKGGCMGGENK